jgi:hypothetical protein
VALPREVETSESLGGFVEILLYLLASVEDRTVTATQDT